MDAKAQPKDDARDARFLFFGDEWASDEVDPVTFRARWWPAHVENLTVEDSTDEQVTTPPNGRQVGVCP